METLQTNTPKVVKIVRASQPGTVSRNIREQIIDTRLPVCAYARVSTNNEEQEDSLERQRERYTQLINGRPDWKLVEIYADPGITGTRADLRKGFQRMLEDCRTGKVKKILVKSISRFARNTVDALKYIQELKELGVSVYFETQNIDTLSPGGEVLITILAAMAEQESRNMSTNIKWAYQKKFQEGEIQLNYAWFLGYTRDENKNLVIVPEQAKTVRRIYREYLNGKSFSAIAKGLTEDGIATPSGKTRWQSGTVQSIVTNEKYYGCAYLGKTCKKDVLSKKRVESDEMYYVENSHPAIIPKETWDLVQAEMTRRKEFRTSTKTGMGRYTSKYPFSKKLICGECGVPFRRHALTHKGENVRTWVCITHMVKGNGESKQKHVLERDVENAFVKAMQELVGDMEIIQKVVRENVATSLDDEVAERMTTIVDQLELLQADMITINRQKREGAISFEKYAEEASHIADKIEALETEKSELEKKGEERLVATKRINDIIQVLNELTPTDEFNGEMFTRLVEEVIILDRTATFVFKAGINKKIEL